MSIFVDGVRVCRVEDTHFASTEDQKQSAKIVVVRPFVNMVDEDTGVVCVPGTYAFMGDSGPLAKIVVVGPSASTDVAGQNVSRVVGDQFVNTTEGGASVSHARGVQFVNTTGEGASVSHARVVLSVNMDIYQFS